MRNQKSNWKNAICYEIYPSSFQDSNGDGFGDLKGITSRLSYLKSLNVDYIWLTPVYDSPMKDNGYDVANFYKVNPLFGTMNDMDELLVKAREKGIKVIMDLVFNHVSEESPWFIESKKSRNNPKSDWFIWRNAKSDGSEPNNWRGIFGGSAWTWCEERQQYYLHTFGDFQPDLNWDNPEVRQALYDIANFWIKKGVGGFRFDAIVYIKKPADFADGVPDASDGMTLIHNTTASTEGILDYLQEFKKNVLDGHDLFTVAEANGVKPEQLKNWVGETGIFDTLFEFNHLPGSDLWFSTKPIDIPTMKRAIIASERATATNGWYPAFFENHDKPRSASAYFSKNVNTIQSSKAIITLLLTLRGTPFVYEGEEIGMINVDWDSIKAYSELNSHAQYEIALQEGFSSKEAIGFVQLYSRDNARTPMQWDSSPNAGFTTGKPWLALNSNYTKINVKTEETDENSTLAYFRKLSNYRQKSEVLQNGDFEVLLENDPQIFAFKRNYNSKSLTILVNLSEAKAFYDAQLTVGKKRILDSLENELCFATSSSAHFHNGTLQPLEAVILE